MRLKYQLFVALLIASALLIALMYIISSWSFSRGLLGYVNQATLQRAQSAVVELESLFEEKQSWNWLSRNSPEWRSLVDENRGAGSRGRPANRRAPRFILADSEKRSIIGPARIDPGTRWLEIKNGDAVVGYFGLRMLAELDSQLDRAFEAQQKKSFAYGSLAMAMLCAVLAVPMASVLLKPLLRMGNAVDSIRQGDLTLRLPAKRKDELGELARNINQLALTLENNRDSRQRWIAEISHELRTPVGILRGELEAVQDGIRGMDLAAVGSLHNEVMRLSRLVDDLHTLSLSDIGALDYQPESIELSPLLSQFLNSRTANLAKASLSLRTEFEETSSVINADPQRLQQLFSNLFQNSVRYTDAGGSLVISTGRMDSGHVRILWSDSSPGVPHAALAKLFDPLYRVEPSRNRATGGAGLGLSIARRIVDAHDGSIEVAASDLGGLTIDIRLPLATGEAPDVSHVAH